MNNLDLEKVKQEGFSLRHQLLSLEEKTEAQIPDELIKKLLLISILTNRQDDEENVTK